MLTRIALMILIGGLHSPVFAKSVKAHTHGESTWSLALEGNSGKLLINAPAVSVVGFEYEPKKKKDIKKSAAALQKFENTIALMVVIPAEYSCVWSKNALDILRAEGDSKHSEVDGEFEVVCQKDLAGAEITFNIQKFFPRFRLVNFEVLFGNIQKSLPVSKSGAKVYLK